MIQDPGGIDTLYFVDFAPGITVNLALSGMDQIIDTSGTEIHLAGIFEALRGTAFDDSITVSPLLDTARFIDGNDGVDVLIFEVDSVIPIDDGFTIRTPGYADVSYVNIEAVILPTMSAVVETAPNLNTILNYPNPFTTSTTIEYIVSEHAQVKLNIYNCDGQLMTNLVDDRQLPGEYLVQWDGSNVNGQTMSPGVYFYVLYTGGFMSSGKMVLMR